MKTLLNTVAASVMLLTCATTYAASTVDLAVKGLIIPSACTPSLSSGGIIDHGKISAKDLRPDNPTLIGTHTMTVAVLCDGAIPFALNSIDNRADSSMMREIYGLGFINGTQKLGWFQLTLQNAVADGVQMKTIASADGGTQPTPVKELVAQMTVDTTIARTDSLDLSNEVTLDGSATLEVKYL